MRRRDANASTALVAPICRPRWNQLRGPTLGANLMARFPSPKANLPQERTPASMRPGFSLERSGGIAATGCAA